MNLYYILYCYITLTMDNIETFVTITPKIEHKKLIVYIVANNNEITELRIFKVIEELKSLFQQIKQNDKVNEFYLVFDITQFKIPTNFRMFTSVSDLLLESKSLIVDKLKFSVIQSENNIFKMFFSLFKKYYEPIKPLYLCRTENDTKECIHSVDSRSNFPNICNILSSE